MFPKVIDLTDFPPLNYATCFLAKCEEPHICQSVKYHKCEGFSLKNKGDTCLRPSLHA